MNEEHEEWLENSALIALWIICLSVLGTYVWLIFSGVVDILIPLKTFITVGLGYWLVNSIISIYLHYDEQDFESPISLFVKIASLLLSIISMLYAIPVIFTLKAEISPPLIVDRTALVFCLIGMFAMMAGLVAMTYRAFFE